MKQYVCQSDRDAFLLIQMVGKYIHDPLGLCIDSFWSCILSTAVCFIKAMELKERFWLQEPLFPLLIHEHVSCCSFSFTTRDNLQLQSSWTLDGGQWQRLGQSNTRLLNMTRFNSTLSVSRFNFSHCTP